MVDYWTNKLYTKIDKKKFSEHNTDTRILFMTHCIDSILFIYLKPIIILKLQMYKYFVYFII